MAVHLRLTRMGRHKRPFYRVVAADSHMKRDGRFIEIVGTYDPVERNLTKRHLKEDRVLDWLQKGRPTHRFGSRPSTTNRRVQSLSGIKKLAKA